MYIFFCCRCAILIYFHSKFCVYIALAPHPQWKGSQSKRTNNQAKKNIIAHLNQPFPLRYFTFVALFQFRTILWRNDFEFTSLHLTVRGFFLQFSFVFCGEMLRWLISPVQYRQLKPNPYEKHSKHILFDD